MLSGLLSHHPRVAYHRRNRWNGRQQPVTLQSFEDDKAVSSCRLRSQNDVKKSKGSEVFSRRMFHRFLPV